MAKEKKKASESAPGLEARLWQMAEALRDNMHAAECQRVALDLIFLEYISDAFEPKHSELEANHASGADPEDLDEYRAASISWVSKEARWQHREASAPQQAIGVLVGGAMAAIERDNPSLKSALPREAGRVGLDKWRFAKMSLAIRSIDVKIRGRNTVQSDQGFSRRALLEARCNGCSLLTP